MAAPASRSTALFAGSCAMVVMALPSGVALITTASRCNSSPADDTGNSQWTFSSYCKALALHPYVDSGNYGGGILSGIFGLPVLVALVGTMAAMRLRRLAPIKGAMCIGVALILALFALDLVLASATFHGV